MFVWRGPIQIAENRRKSPKIRASGRPPRVTHITTDRKIKLRRSREARSPPSQKLRRAESVEPVAAGAPGVVLRKLCMAPLCGKLLTPEDRKVWTQAITLLLGLKTRNGFGEKDLAAAVGTALHRAASGHNTHGCEDCGAKVASGAAHSGVPHGGGAVPWGWRFLNPAAGWPPVSI